MLGFQVGCCVSPTESGFYPSHRLYLHNPKYTKLCLESARKRTQEPHGVIRVDNGSTDGAMEYLGSRSNVQLIENGRSPGFALGNNRGLWETLMKLLACALSGSTIGIVGPCSNYVTGSQFVPNVPCGGYLGIVGFFGQAWSTQVGKSRYPCPKGKFCEITFGLRPCNGEKGGLAMTM